MGDVHEAGLGKDIRRKERLGIGWREDGNSLIPPWLSLRRSFTHHPHHGLAQSKGPPHHAKESPYVLGLYRYMTDVLGWHVKVVLPSAQKSWIGKAYHIKEVTKGKYFYPKEDGTGETSNKSRPLKAGELAEWILLDGTPATCANVALHNLYPGEIDLVVSGPNLGRNTSSAFALSSGTIGAAMSTALSKVRAVAISYGIVVHPTPAEWTPPAHNLGGRIIEHLWHNWGLDECGLRDGEVDLYSVNIPLIEKIMSEEGLNIYWTKMWRNSYGRLFKQIPPPERIHTQPAVNPAGPDAPIGAEEQVDTKPDEDDYADSLLFKWSPEMKGLITPSASSLPIGSDGWAIHNGGVSVTALRASFGEPHSHEVTDADAVLWKMKL